MKVVIATDSHQPNARYRDALLASGFLPEELELVTPSDGIPPHFDGLLLAGGADVDPRRYGETALPGVEVHPERDEADFRLLSRAVETGAPVFGICRGLQVINVARGGTLWQDIPSQRSRGTQHDCFREEGFDPSHLAHAVRFHPNALSRDSLFEKAAQTGASFMVNSRHHQAVKDLAPGLSAVAASSDDLVEAFEDPARNTLAVQWHPEDLVSHPAHKALFRQFLEMCRTFARSKGRAEASFVEISLEGAIPVVRLNRPESDNMIAGRMAELLVESLETLQADPTVPAIVVTGTGRYFSKGTDPATVGAFARLGDEAGYRQFLEMQARAVIALFSSNRPAVAALEGPAVGFGASLALACDVRVATSRGRDLMAFSCSGLPAIPDLGTGLSFLLRDKAGSGAALDFFFSFEPVSLARARELRLIDFFVEEGTPRTFALARAALYASRPETMTRILKTLQRAPEIAPLISSIERERETLLGLFRESGFKAHFSTSPRRSPKEHLFQ